MQVQININDKIVGELFLLHNSFDFNYIFNQLISEKLKKNDCNIKDIFGEVEFFDDYDYKKSRQRNENIISNNYFLV